MVILYRLDDILTRGGLVMNEITKYDEEYITWIRDISSRFKRSQIKAAASVNREMLLLYWGIGEDIVEKKMLVGYGSDFYNKLSNDLKRVLPDVKSFSPRNLRYMADFYVMYKDIVSMQTPYRDDKNQNLQQPVANFDGKNIFLVPWGHHIQILTKCKGNRDKAVFFVNQTIKNNWSRAVLLNFLDTGLYEREGKAVTNFTKVLPDVGSDLAREMTKDPYNFDFLTLRDDYDEKELKDALMNNLQKFLLELGKGFAFVGREYRLVVGETEQFIDMLFYNVRQHCYVVIEIKTRPFEPGDMGQLGTYIAATDGILRLDGDNPTIGLLICKTKDNVLAQYSTDILNVPVGISEYELDTLIPKEFKSSMPTIEEIERELRC